MKIRTIIAATCAALAFSMAGPIYAHDSEAQTVTKNLDQEPQGRQFTGETMASARKQSGADAQSPPDYQDPLQAAARHERT